MADQATPVWTGQKVTGWKGSQAGKSFVTTGELQAKKQEDDEWAEYARSIGQAPAAFSGLGGGALRAKHKAQFETWKSTRTGTGNLATLAGGE